MVGRIVAGAVPALLLSLAGAAASSGETHVSEGSTPESWGTQSETLVVIPGLALIPRTSTMAYIGNGAGRECTAGTCLFIAPLQLPAGAQVVRIELDGCDTSGTESISVRFDYCPHPGACLIAAEIEPVGSPGCGLFSAPVAQTIDNANNVYMMSVNFNGNGSDLVVRTVRLAYKLQVSPPPASATFADVPTSHPFFQFVEALAASGITGGCGGGNFCPGDPLTRGQMAAFLAKALGLHWPQ